jgi:hypothetical protein
MIGRKKLSAIRQELHSVLAATGDDPFAWLEQRMAAPSGQGPGESIGNEILRSLQRFLAATGKQKQRRQTHKTRKPV